MDRERVEPAVDRFPGERATRWVQHHERHAARSTYLYPFVWDPSAPAIGPFCTDVDGNVFLDFTSHVGSAPLGYNSPKILEPLREFDLVDPLKIAGQDVYVAPGDDPAAPGPTGLMDRLTTLCAHYDMDTVFLSNSGAEAVENAIKVCYQATPGNEAVTFAGAFHGRTLGALSFNRSKAIHRRGYPSLAGVHTAPFCRDDACTEATCSCGFFDGGTSSLRRMLDPEQGFVDPDQLAFVMLEPVQGEGGFHVPSESFMEEIATLQDEMGLLVIADEVQAGLGRTGELWAADHYPIEPDVIACAKALRVGATVGREELFPDEPGRLSSTWGGGDILGSIQGSLTLDAIVEGDLPANAIARGRQAHERLADETGESVVDVRSKGLMLGIEFASRDERNAVIAAALDRGLLTMGCGYRSMRLLPPLDVTEREIDLGIDRLLDAVAAAR